VSIQFKIETAIRATNKLRRGEEFNLKIPHYFFWGRNEFENLKLYKLRMFLYLRKLVISSKWTRCGISKRF